MKSIKDLREYCTEVDIEELVGITLTDDEYKRRKWDIEAYYRDITVKRLLVVYSEYNGLADLPYLESTGYAIDITSLIEEL